MSNNKTESVYIQGAFRGITCEKSVDAYYL